MGTAFSKKGNLKALPTQAIRVPEFRLKAILVGSPFSGRSSIFERYISNRFDYEHKGSPHTLRMGSKVWLISEPTGGLAYLNLWDTPRYAATETGGLTLWAGAGVIFVCVDGKSCKEIDAEVSKWCQDPVILRAHNMYGTVVCVLITKADALQRHQEDAIKTTMQQMIQMPGYALDTWSFCSAKTSRGLQGPEDTIKILFHQCVKDEAKRQRRQTGRGRRSLLGSVLGDAENIRASLVALARPRASLVEGDVEAMKAPRRSLAGAAGRSSISAVDMSYAERNRNSIIPVQYRPSVITENRSSRPTRQHNGSPGSPFRGSFVGEPTDNSETSPGLLRRSIAGGGCLSKEVQRSSVADTSSNERGGSVHTLEHGSPGNQATFRISVDLPDSPAKDDSESPVSQLLQPAVLQS